ncbi:MAG: DinB family protein [Acidobacteriota bacterium]
MTAAEARRLIRYTVWASTKVLDAVKALPPEVRDTPNGISHQSIAGTASHIYWADRAWIERLIAPGGPFPPKTNFEETTVQWPETLRQWQAWADSIDDDELTRVARYTSAIFGPGATPIDQIVMHVVNHATMHRGQLVGMLRQLGITPPQTDMIYFFREETAKATTP